jgi:hypothetical protein
MKNHHRWIWCFLKRTGNPHCSECSWKCNSSTVFCEPY